MLLDPHTATDITLACCILHNLIRERKGTITDVHEELLQLTEDEEDGDTSHNSSRSVAAITVGDKFVFTLI
jgi:hypothetical protein